jgi:hypothetical protein
MTTAEVWADAFVTEIARAFASGVAHLISRADVCQPPFDASGYRDGPLITSGDGANNSGPFVTLVRDDVVSSAPSTVRRSCRSGRTVHHGYRDPDVYTSCVIGGPAHS